MCHDLGHGPFSHFFDGFYIPRAKPGCKWQHEQASCDLFELLIDSNPGVAKKLIEYGLGREEIDFIKQLIQGSFIFEFDLHSEGPYNFKLNMSSSVFIL